MSIDWTKVGTEQGGSVDWGQFATPTPAAAPKPTGTPVEQLYEQKRAELSAKKFDIPPIEAFRSLIGRDPTPEDIQSFGTAPPGAFTRVAGRALQGFGEGAILRTLPIGRQGEPQSKGEEYAQGAARLLGNIGGYTMGVGQFLGPLVKPLVGQAGVLAPTIQSLANRFGPVFGPKIAPYFGMAVQAAGEGTAWSLLDAAANERDKIAKMNPVDATLYLIKKAGITAAEWGAMVPAVHGIVEGIRWLPSRDARLHPELYSASAAEPTSTVVTPAPRVNQPALQAGNDTVDSVRVIQDMFGRPTYEAVAPELGILRTGMAENFVKVSDAATVALKMNSRATGTNPRALGVSGRQIASAVEEMKAAGFDAEAINAKVAELRARARGVQPVEGQEGLPGVPGGAGPSVRGLLTEERGAIGPRNDTVTVYHGQGGAGGAGAAGEWWTTDPKRAASYGADVQRVDVPRSVVEAGQLEARRQGSGTGTDVVLPNEWIKRAQGAPEVKPQVYNLGRRTGPDYAAGTPGLDARWVMGTDGKVYVESPTAYHRDMVARNLGGDAQAVKATGTIYNGRVVVDRSTESSIAEGDSIRQAVANMWMQVRDTLGNERGSIMLNKSTRQIEQQPINAIRDRKELMNLGIIGASEMMNGNVERGDWEDALLDRIQKTLPGYHPAVLSNLDKIYNASQAIYERTMTETAGQLAGVTRLSELLAKGESGAEWYPVMAKQLSTIVPPVHEEAFLKYLALTSKGANIKTNVANAVKAMVQDILGLPAKGLFFSTEEVAKYRAGQNPGGIKIDDFARAPFDPNVVVVDRRTMKLFGFQGEVPNDVQREVIKQRVTEFAQQAGLTPREAQAMLWVGYGNDPAFTRNYSSEGKVPTSQNFVEYMDHNPHLKNRIAIALNSREPFAGTPEDFQNMLKNERYIILGSEPAQGRRATLLSGENYAMAMQRQLADRMVDPGAVTEVKGRWIDPKTGEVFDGESSYLIRGGALDTRSAQQIARAQGQSAFITEKGLVDTETGLMRAAKGDVTLGPEAVQNPEGHSIVQTANGPLPFALGFEAEPTTSHPELQSVSIQQQLGNLLKSEIGAVGKYKLVYDKASGSFVPQGGGVIPAELQGTVDRLNSQFGSANFQNTLVTGQPLQSGSADVEYRQGDLFTGVQRTPDPFTQKPGPKNVDVRAPWVNMVREVAASNLLYGPHTPMVKTASETLGLVLRPLDLLATGHVREAAYDVFGVANHWHDATTKLVNALFTSASPTTEGAVPGMLGQVVRFPFRVLDAGMQFFQELNRGGSLYSNAFKIAMEEKAPNVAERITEIVRDPESALKPSAYDALVNRMQGQAKYYTFQSDLGKTGSLLRQLSQTDELKPLAWFFKVPANLIKMGIDYSPLGFGEVVGQRIKDRQFGADAVERLGRALIGSAIAGGAFMAAEHGLITGEGPTNPAMRANLRAQGWMPNSIKVGDKYVDISTYFKPIAPAILAAANLSEAFHNDKDGSAVAHRMMQFIGTEITSMPFLSSLNDMFKAIQGGATGTEKAAGGLTNAITAPVVPRFVQDIAKATDPFERTAKGPIDQLKAKVPGLREQLLPQQDVLGRPVQSEYVGGMPFIARARTTRDEPILQELYRLGVPLGVPQQTHLVRGVPVQRTPEELFNVRTERGQRYIDMLGSVIQSPGYQRLADADKTVLLKKFVRRISSLRSEVAP